MLPITASVCKSNTPWINLGGISRKKFGYSRRKSNATHYCQFVQYFHMFRQGYSWHCLEFLMCAQTLMHAICAVGLFECHKRVHFGRKIFCCTGELNPRQYCTRLFSLTAKILTVSGATALLLLLLVVWVFLMLPLGSGFCGTCFQSQTTQKKLEFTWTCSQSQTDYSEKARVYLDMLPEPNRLLWKS